MLTLRLPNKLVQFLTILGSKRKLAVSLTILFTFLAVAGCNATWFVPLLVEGRTSFGFSGQPTAVPILFLGALIFGLYLVRKRSDRLDKTLKPIFTPWTDVSKPRTGWGRFYSGEEEGRHVYIHYHAPNPKRLTTAVVSLALEADVKARLAVFGSEFRSNKPPTHGLHILRLDDSAFDGLVVATTDTRWAQGFLTTPSVRDTTLRLFGTSDENRANVLIFQPDAVVVEQYYLNSSWERNKVLEGVNQPNVQNWIKELKELAFAAETLSAPTRTTTTTEYEMLLRTDPNAFLVGIGTLAAFGANVVIWIVVMLMIA